MEAKISFWIDIVSDYVQHTELHENRLCFQGIPKKQII